ncbi:GNAT family N-acetyltransferase [Sphaerospermopsis aphanizomenoides BCCUSP55]|uniref:GNAT family N-acetyltransferase n=1 Tax=Sphaerospermopsis aphanizomenoides TaxID=459663 RepID=UPI0019086236|nr:GNAT family N-acetyltransferase [Sphaerospermopsis aphanizomenoides]MBK1988289.1 GNAT family N-acetyltransferase [Sphaerospermopsis aphanizomenoides BCCUSP55]
MIRPTTPEDTNALIAVAKTIGFQPQELDYLRKMLFNYLKDGETESFWLTYAENEPVGVAYCEPERMTHQTWNLLLIAIREDLQGQGRGGKLLDYVEQTLIERGGRMLLVETSGLPDFERTRSFYVKCGFQQEARIRDFYAEGDDKIVFRKVLNAD